MVALLSCIHSPKLLAFRNLLRQGQILKSNVDLMEISKCHQCPQKTTDVITVGSITRCPALHRIQPWTILEVLKKKNISYIKVTDYT